MKFWFEQFHDWKKFLINKTGDRTGKPSKI